MTNTQISFLTVSLCFGILRADGSVQIKVKTEHLSNGQVAYKYQVENHSDKEIDGIDIGHVMDEASGYIWELASAPTGVRFGIDDRVPVSWGFCPTDWRASFDRDEEGTKCAVRFRISYLSSTIKPGQTVDYFRVLLPKQDRSYLTAHYMAHVFRKGSGHTAYFVGLVEPYRIKSTVRQNKNK